MRIGLAFRGNLYTKIEGIETGIFTPLQRINPIGGEYARFVWTKNLPGGLSRQRFRPGRQSALAGAAG